MDAELVQKKLAFVETCLSELRRLARLEHVETDVRERRFVEHTLQLAIQACMDAASHVVSSERLGEPQTNHALFRLLADAGWISAALGGQLTAAVGFRNILVHGYTAADPAIVRDVAENRVGDLQAFVDALRARMADHA